MPLNALEPNDYRQILRFYKERIPKTKRNIKKKAESIISAKLCRCIKKVENKYNSEEGKAIGICTKTIINQKGYVRGSFKCKKKSRIKLYTRREVAKTKKRY